MHILAFGASNSLNSINQSFAEYVASQFDHAKVEVLRLYDYDLPLYSSEREKAGIPQLVVQFMAHLAQADLIVISFAEHNGSYTAAFKNLFDWCSRYKEKTFESMSFFMLATSPGARGGMGVLQAALDRFPRHGAKVLDSFSLPSFGVHFSPDQGILDPVLRATLEEKIQSINAHFTS